MSDLISDWRSYLEVERGRKPATIKLYLGYLEALERDAGDPATLSTDDLRAWLHSKGGKAGTVSNRITALKGFYAFLVRSGILRDDPALPLEAPRGRGTPGGPVENLDEVLLILDDVDRRALDTGTNHKRYVGQSRDMAVFLAETGLRVSEAVACKWPVPCPSEVKVARKGRTRTSLAVSQAARKAWDRLGGKWPIGARATQRRFEKAGFHPHQLRHWYRANIGKRHGHPQAPQTSSLLARKRTVHAIDEIAEQYSNEDLTVILGFLTKLLDAR